MQEYQTLTHTDHCPYTPDLLPVLCRSHKLNLPDILMVRVGLVMGYFSD